MVLDNQKKGEKWKITEEFECYSQITWVWREENINQ